MLPRIPLAGLQLILPVPPSAPQLVSLPLARKLLDRAAPPSAWALSAEQFQIALERSAAQRFAAASPAANILEKYLDTLNLADLVLATACSAGNSAAWDFFVANFRPELYRAARAIVGGSLSGSGAGSDAAESGARDLADSLYADLYGLRESEGQRKSLFDYFHGRSKLTTWLRAILAQRHVDQFRRTRRLDPLDDSGSEDSSQPIAGTAAPISRPTQSARNTSRFCKLCCSRRWLRSCRATVCASPITTRTISPSRKLENCWASTKPPFRANWTAPGTIYASESKESFATKRSSPTLNCVFASITREKSGRST